MWFSCFSCIAYKRTCPTGDYFVPFWGIQEESCVDDKNIPILAGILL